MRRISIERVLLIVLDSVGVGALPDAKDYGDKGANTVGNVARHVGGLRLPNLQRLGLGNVIDVDGLLPAPTPIGAYGKMAERSAGKDTTTGHWELAGLHLRKPFATFPDGFPPEIIQAFEREVRRGVIGNKAASGDEIIQELGEEHVKTGKLIVYTSSDSVFQIAAHEKVLPVEELYWMCGIARRIVDPYRIGRVIARPFVGPTRGRYQRTYRRRDFSMPPPRPTVLDRLEARGLQVLGIGKISDIFDGRGLTDRLPSQGNTDGMIKMMEAMEKIDRGLIVTNLLDFDTEYGHRRDPAGYARCLEEFDVHLSMLLSRARDETDLIILTADHGNDPTMPGTDHTREYVPLLVAGPRRAAGVKLGVRKTFADVGATIAEAFGVGPLEIGESFLRQVA